MFPKKFALLSRGHLKRGISIDLDSFANPLSSLVVVNAEKLPVLNFNYNYNSHSVLRSLATTTNTRAENFAWLNAYLHM